MGAAVSTLDRTLQEPSPDGFGRTHRPVCCGPVRFGARRWAACVVCDTVKRSDGPVSRRLKRRGLPTTLLCPPSPSSEEGKGPQRWPQKRLGRRLEEVAKAVEGGYCRLQMPLKPALAVRET